MAASNGPMGLTRWNDPNDLFSYVSLYTNFDLIDAHDHAPGHGVQIPTDGIANLAIDATKLAPDAVTAGKIPSASIAGDRLVNFDVPDTKLASPNNAVWNTIFQTHGVIQGGYVAGTYLFSGVGAMTVSGGTDQREAFLLPWDDAWYIVANKATKLRVLGVAATNATAPAATFSLGLYPVASGAGSSNHLSITVGAVLAGSPVILATPGASSRSIMTGAEFDSPADGVYALGITTSGTTANSSLTGFNALLQIRHV